MIAAKKSRWIVAVALLTGGVLLTGCNPPAPTTGDGAPTAADPNQETVVLTVHGMTCEGCGGTVTKAIAEVPGVESVDVSLDNEQATVAGATGQLDQAAILAAVEAAGYEAAASSQ